MTVAQNRSADRGGRERCVVDATDVEEAEGGAGRGHDERRERREAAHAAGREDERLFGIEGAAGIGTTVTLPQVEDADEAVGEEGWIRAG